LTNISDSKAAHAKKGNRLKEHFFRPTGQGLPGEIFFNQPPTSTEMKPN
jgi:hypothetical protein